MPIEPEGRRGVVGCRRIQKEIHQAFKKALVDDEAKSGEYRREQMEGIFLDVTLYCHKVDQGQSRAALRLKDWPFI